MDIPVRFRLECSSALWRAALLCLALAFQMTTGVPQKKEKLASNYREWLDRDVVYIITNEERENFLKLASDEARDKFIE
jgi:hypothetical protein